MALSKIKTKPGGDRDATYRRMVAEQIVDRLKLSNWRFEKDPPASPRLGAAGGRASAWLAMQG
jgi:hypothetical protein